MIGFRRNFLLSLGDCTFVFFTWRSPEVVVFFKHGLFRIRHLAHELMIPLGGLRSFLLVSPVIYCTFYFDLADNRPQPTLKRSTTNTNSLLSFFFEQNKSKEISNSKGHASASAIKSDADQTSISLSNDTESIKRQETKTQVNIVISYIEQNDEQGIGQRVNSPDKHKFFSCKVFLIIGL